MIKVFVSSTFQDLCECREQVRLALRRLGLIDVAMEYYVAESDRPVERCIADAQECDLYVGIFAWRYGYVPYGQNASITELEYRAARIAGKDCLIFLVADDAPWPMDQVEVGAFDQIKRLREELAAVHVCAFFATAAELRVAVTEGIANWLRKSGVASQHPPSVSDEAWEGYRRRTLQQYGRLDLDALTPPQREEYLQISLRSVFVEQSAREHPPPVELPKEIWQELRDHGEIAAEDLPAGIDFDDLARATRQYETEPARPILGIVCDPAQKHFVILGDPGAGKSTLARYLTVALASRELGERLAPLYGHLPILIELRSYARLRDRCETFLDYLDYLARTEGLGLDHATLKTLLRGDGRVLVIFDGLDELFDPAERETATRQIAGFADAYPMARILVTSRIIGYRRGILTDAGFVHYTLQDLDEGRIQEFLTGWFALALYDRPGEADQRRRRLLAAIVDSRPIRELAGNPLLLTVLAIIGKHQELPRERWQVYDHAVAVLVQHWDVNRHLRDVRIQADFISEEDKKELLRRVAYHMQAGVDGLAGNHITGVELSSEFEAYLDERYQRNAAEAKVVASAMIGQFRERNFILSRYGAGVYGFVHRAFLEFFCAGAIVWRFEKTQEISFEELRNGVFAAHWADESWQEVLRLVIGMVAERFADDLITFLADQSHTLDQAGEVATARAIALACQCVSEIRNIRVVAQSAKVVLDAVLELLRQAQGSVDGRRDVLIDVLIDERIVPAIVAVGPAWPGREVFLERFRSHGTASRSALVARFLGRLFGALFSDLDEVRISLLRIIEEKVDWRERAGALVGLAQGWSQHRDTRAALSFITKEDSDENFRHTAVEVIKTYYAGDGGFREILEERAVNDPIGRIRQGAIDALTQGWREDSAMLELMLDRATRDIDSRVRDRAVRIILERRSRDEIVFGLVRRLTQDETHTEAQLSIVQLIAEGWQQDPRARNLLVEFAVGSLDWSIRVRAVEALLEQWPGDEEILKLVGELASKDDDGHVRRAALHALSKNDRKVRNLPHSQKP